MKKIIGEKMYTRPLYQKIMERLTASRAFMQVLGGPHQVGKTTVLLLTKETL